MSRIVLIGQSVVTGCFCLLFEIKKEGIKMTKKKTTTTNKNIVATVEKTGYLKPAPKYDSKVLLELAKPYTELDSFTDGSSRTMELVTEKLVLVSKRGKEMTKRKSKYSAMKKYGDENGKYTKEIDVITSKITKYAKRIEEINKEVSSLSFTLNDREYNQCVLIAMNQANDFDIKMEGMDARIYNERIDMMSKVIKQFCYRFITLEIADSDDENYKNGMISLLNKNEYNTLKKCVEFISFGLFGKKIKYTSNDIGVILFESVSTKNGTLEVKNQKAIKKSVFKRIGEKSNEKKRVKKSA